MRPRLTKKVIRGLHDVSHAMTEAQTFAPSTDAAVAILWIEEINRWATTPRRKGKVPPQLIKALRRRSS
jgi:hypothetical protein